MSSSLSSSLLPLYARAPFAFVRGEGVTLYDEQGTGYLDFGAGIAVSAFGHAHPKLVEALKTQADKLWHTSNLYGMPGQEALARRLTAASFADKVFFCNSGAEAMEAAIKMARHYHFAAGAPERYRLITFEGAFHGRTLATIAAGGQAKYLEGFGPRVPGFDQVAFGDLAAVKDAIGPETAGILVEPIQGEGGVRPLPDGFLRALRTLCDEEGLLLVLDEVQTGMGRTGKLFAHEWSGVVPDIMGVAKALGGGFPVGAVLASEKAATGMGAGTHGTTFGGNQLAMAVAGAALDLVLEPGFLPHVQEMGLRLKQRLAELVDNYPDIFADVRGSGLLLGLKMNCVNTDFVKALFEERMLAVQAGDNVVRLLPPLIVQEADILDAAGRLERAAARLRKEAT